jgi:GPH family glycoside/pentoside/hexuronide:cation symporter
MGLGVFLLWPLAKKFGKRNIMISAVSWLLPRTMSAVLGGRVIRSFGLLPTYLMAAMLAEVLDHVEWKSGFCCDDFSAIVVSITMTVGMGIGSGLFNMGLGAVSYTPPLADGTIVAQTAAAQSYFIFGYFDFPLTSYALVFILMLLFKAEKNMPQIRMDIAARRKAKAKSRGEVYVSPEEKSSLEVEEQEQIAEGKCKEELKSRCAKNDFPLRRKKRSTRRNWQRKPPKAKRGEKSGCAGNSAVPVAW